MSIKIAVDFDGVLHSFKSGWQGPNKISDPPVPGAIEWLREMIECEYIDVSIYTARSWYLFGSRRVRKWLIRHGLEERYVRKLKFWLKKPVADLVIDDRCFCFMGYFPSVCGILKFKPWHGNSVFGDTK